MAQTLTSPNMIRGAVILAITLNILMPCPAAALYINNRENWKALDRNAKSNYVAGLIDGLFELMAPEEFYRTDARQCVLDLEVTNTTMVDMIENAYSDVANWPRAPVLVLWEVYERVLPGID